MPTALVTGANRGIGLAAARQLAERGFTLWIGARDPGRGAAAEAELRRDGLDVRVLPLDVTDEASVRAAVEIVEARTPVLDVLINNAAVSRERDEGMTQPYAPSALPMQNLRETFEVNFFGAVLVTQAFLPLIRRSPAGRIVNVSSGLGSFDYNSRPPTDFPPLNILGYKTSKAALNMATVLFAAELAGTAIKVNAANPSAPTPGPVATDLSGPGRAEVLKAQGFGTAEEGARTLVHLAQLPADGPSGVWFDIEHGVYPW